MNLPTKLKRSHRHRETDLWLPRERGCGKKGWEAGVSRCELLHTEQIHTILLCSTENYTVDIL